MPSRLYAVIAPSLVPSSDDDWPHAVFFVGDERLALEEQARYAVYGKQVAIHEGTVEWKPL